jgi:membrane AbrB-like protein
MHKTPIDETAMKAASARSWSGCLCSSIGRLPRAATLMFAAAVIGTFLAALAGGLFARFIGMPLPFMLGAFFVTMGLGLYGVPIRHIRQARTLGQFVVGSSIGTQFTPGIVLKLVLLLPFIVGGALLSMVVGAVCALMLLRMTQLDRKTAFFATMPAGVVEMANIANRYGGTPEPILVVQAMRVALTVTAAPFFVVHFAGAGARRAIDQAATMPALMLGMVAVAAAIAGLLLARLRVPNSWFLGAAIGSALLGAFGLAEGRVPDILLIVAQVVMGISLGTQFRHEFLTRLFGVMRSAVVTVPFAIVAMGLLGIACAYLLTIPVSTMVLAFAPAGMGEMVLTGKVLGLDAPVIAGFQMVRILIVMTLCVPAYRLFDWAVTRFAARG